MELGLFNTYSVTKYGGEVFSCGCGKTHELNTKAIFFESGAASKLPDALSLCVPPLSLAFVVAERSIADKVFPRIDKTVSRGGFRVATHFFENSPKADLDTCRSVTVPEDARVIVGVGGGTVADIVKYKAQQLSLPCVILCSSPAAIGVMAPSAMLTDKRIEQTFRTAPPKAVVCDTLAFNAIPKSLTAAAFGGLISKLTALFDWKTAALVNSEYFCPNLFDAALAVIDGCLDKVCGAEFHSREIAAVIAEDNLRFSAVCQLTGSSRLTSGAESQCAHALRLLFEAEERECFLRGENEFLFARIIMKMYKNLLSKSGTFFVPPPDNNLRMELMAEYFGLDESAVADKIRPIIAGKAQKLCTYKVGEYSDELYSLACAFDIRLFRAWKAFKRLYDDDGYALTSYIDPTDASLCVSLAPDLKEKYTMLTYMKNAGLLEAYLR